MSISQNFPSTRPSLNLNFARSQKLDPRITFTRSSSATYTGGDGLIKSAATNTPRFDFNATTGDCLGLLIEESRTNLITYSEQFDNAVYNNPASGNTITANAITAPDGTNSADLVSNVGQAVSLVEYSLITVSASSTNDYYVTIYAKKGTASYFTFNCYYNGNTEDNVDFNFDTGVVSNVPYTGEYIFQNVGNGWYRCGFRVTRDSTGTRTLLLFRFWESGRAVTSGNTYFWGAQVEAGAFPTSYIPTVASTVTRSADNASITGTNFSSFYNPSEGSFSFNMRNVQQQPSTGAYTRLIDLRGTPTANNYFVIAIIPNSLAIYNEMKTNATFQLDFGATYPSSNNIIKITIGLQQNNFVAYNLNTQFLLDTSVTLPVLNSFYIGRDETGTSQLNGTISQLSYYPVRLSNSQLQNLTK
jgi:hypothetical protein